MLIYNPLFKQEIIDDAIKHAQEVFPNESAGAIINDTYVAYNNDAIDPEISFAITKESFYKSLIKKEVQAVIHSHINNSSASSIDQMKCDDMEVPFGLINLIDKEIVTHFVFWGKGIPRAALKDRPFFFGVFDCLQLVCDYYREKYRLKLPNPPRDISFITNGRKLFEDYLGELTEKFDRVELNNLEEDDILFYMFGGRIIHVGVYTGNNRVLAHWLNQRSGFHDLSYKKDMIKMVMRKK
jgi:cell wall-associated NlpC family hydrolase